MFKGTLRNPFLFFSFMNIYNWNGLNFNCLIWRTYQVVESMIGIIFWRRTQLLETAGGFHIPFILSKFTVWLKIILAPSFRKSIDISNQYGLSQSDMSTIIKIVVLSIITSQYRFQIKFQWWISIFIKMKVAPSFRY